MDSAIERTKLAIDEAQAPVVRRIYRDAASGVGAKQIALQLNHEGNRSPGGKRWGNGTVHAILSNPVYKGNLVFGKTGCYHLEAGLGPGVVCGAIPAIIDPQMFDGI